MALRREKDEFFAELTAVRDERGRLETAAALSIQRSYRGYRWRGLIKREKRKKGIKSRLRARLKGVMGSLGIVVEGREKRRYILAAHNDAAVVVQCAWRQFLARRVVAKFRADSAYLLAEKGAILLQGLYRKRASERHVHARKQHRVGAARESASSSIQRVFRRHIARRSASWKKMCSRHNAAVTIQNGWKVALARIAAHSWRQSLIQVCSVQHKTEQPASHHSSDHAPHRCGQYSANHSRTNAARSSSHCQKCTTAHSACFNGSGNSMLDSRQP